MLRRGAIFVAVGAFGFLVDSGVLILASTAGVPALPARVISILAAVTSTWVLNRHWTFEVQRSERGLFIEWISYLIASGAGLIVNFGAFLSFVRVKPEIPGVLVAGVAVGSLAGMIVNFVLYRFWVFKPR
jgi:putative flippase GtrA